MDSFTSHPVSDSDKQGVSFSSQHCLNSPSSVDKPSSSSLSDTEYLTAHQSAQLSDEEIILASSRPKKRAGRRVFKETRHPVFRGVRSRNNDKWVCELREPNKKSRIWLGTYPTAEMAARAHDVAALALRGKQACLNFADSAWRLPIPASEDPLDIRRAAAEAAELFRPEEFGGGDVSSGEYRENMEEEDEMEGEEEVGTEMKGTSSSSTITKKEDINIDDDDVYDMPMLLNNMAEGLLLSPPRHYLEELESKRADDAVESGNDFNLWSFSD